MTLTYPVPGGRITGRFHSPSVADPRRIHGAIDIAPVEGTVIVAPESGFLFAWVAIRPAEGVSWPHSPVVHGEPYHFGSYFYDMHGGVLVLQVPDPARGIISRTHIISHSYGNTLFNREPFTHVRKHWVEQQADDRFPILAVYTDKILVCEGDVIGAVGNAGFSTGPHIHWELHNGGTPSTHRYRMDPAEYLEPGTG